jgi:DNA-binding transcriptional ArsR family regulator
MAFSKKNSFEKRQARIAAFADALSHPARIAILETLAKKKNCVCGEIVDVMPLAQSTVSQHLKELRELGLVRGEVDGPKSCYCIDVENWRSMVKEVDTFFALIDNNTSDKECC